MIAYHQSERLSAAALTELAAGQPSLLPLALACKDRFLPKDGSSRHSHLHAALIFLNKPHLSDAAASIAAARKVPVWQAEGNILAALNAASDLFESHKAVLLNKGVVQVSGRFATIGESVHQIQFYRTIPQIAPSLRPVAEDVFCAARARRPGKEAVPERLLPFIAAQLLPKGAERAARLNALAMTVPCRAHAGAMAQAAAQIVRSADKCGLMVPPYHFETVARPAVPASRRSARRDHDQSITPPSSGLAARIVTRFRAVEEQVLGLFRAA